jgi:hypothetical protein
MGTTSYAINPRAAKQKFFYVQPEYPIEESEVPLLRGSYARFREKIQAQGPVLNLESEFA